MPPMQSGLGNLVPPTPGKKALLGMAGAMLLLLACFAVAFMAFPSEGAPTTTTPAATLNVSETITATLSVTSTQVLTPTVTPIVPVTETVATNTTPTVSPTPPCTLIKGAVFNDANVNQIRDNGEPGIAGASIQLQAQDSAVLSFAVADSAGAFQMLNIPFGAYRLVAGAPPGLVPTTPSQLPVNVSGCGGFDDLNFGFGPLPPAPGPAPANPPTQAPAAPTNAPPAVPPTPIIIVVTAAPTLVPPTLVPPTLVPPTPVPPTDVPPPPTQIPTPTPTVTPEFFITDVTAQHLTTDCPSLYFGGTITASGQGTAMYQWHHENGSTTPAQTITFLASGSLPVPLYGRELTGGEAFGTNGWVRLEVLLPNALESDPILFQFTCNSNPVG